MSVVRIFLVIIVVGSIGYFGLKTYVFSVEEMLSIVQFQLADDVGAALLLNNWTYEWKEELRWLIRVDYVLLISYTLLLAGLCTDRMNQEAGRVLNSTLRLSILLVLIAGVLGIVGNIILTHNINYPKVHANSSWIVWLRIILTVWVLSTIVAAYLIQGKRQRVRDRRASDS